MKSSFVSRNMSTDALQAKSLPPLSAINSRNSGTGGMSSASMRFCMSCVTNDDTPGKPPSIVGRCSAGLPTVATCRCAWRAMLIASRPKKVKKRFASIPSRRAPLAMNSPG